MRAVAFVIGALGLTVLILPLVMRAFMEKMLKGPEESSSYLVVVHYPWWLLTVGVLFLVLALVFFITTPKEPIQSTQHNAGSLPSSADLPPSETPSPPSPRG